MSGKLYCTISPPRGGKSTYAEKWRKQKMVESCRCGRGIAEGTPVVISGDAFRKALTGKEFLPQTEAIVFCHMDTAIRALLASGYSVLVDETNSSEGTILRMLRIDIDAEFIIIDTPEEVCIERAVKTGKEYLVKPIRRIAKQIRELTKDWPAKLEQLKQQIRDRQESDTEV